MARRLCSRSSGCGRTRSRAPTWRACCAPISPGCRGSPRRLASIRGAGRAAGSLSTLSSPRSAWSWRTPIFCRPRSARRSTRRCDDSSSPRSSSCTPAGCSPTIRWPSRLAGIPAEDPLPLECVLLHADRAEFARLAGPDVEAELCRRARARQGGQLGLNVAFLLLSAEALRQLGASADLAATRDTALDRLVDAAWAGRAGRPHCSTGARRESRRHPRPPGLSTGAESVHGMDEARPVRALARGADGEFNSVAVRTEHRLIDALRKQRGRERFTIDLTGPTRTRQSRPSPMRPPRVRPTCGR